MTHLFTSSAISDLSVLSHSITHCHSCTRLRKHCQKTAEMKRKAYLQDTYWGKPVTGFGDPAARLMIVGLAPGAHGANRTGRVFTGDRSGDWLYRALNRAEFCNQTQSTHLGDGLKLKDAYITCAVKCAPPDNRPTPQEIARCSRFLDKEMSIFEGQAQVWIALGQLSLNSLWPYLKQKALSPELQKKRPRFQHGKQIPLQDGKFLLLSYHPSQQNTFTGRLTEPMFDSIFQQAREILKSQVSFD